MARDNEDEGAVAIVEENTEAPAEVTAEAPAEATEATSAEKPEKPAGPTAEEIQTALDNLMKVAEEVVATRDEAGGDLAEDELAKVKTGYAALPSTKARNTFRDMIDNKMRDVLATTLNAVHARAYVLLGGALKSTTTRESVARTPVDPTEAFVQRMSAMQLAPNLVEVPEGVSEDWVSRTTELSQSLAEQVGVYRQYLATKGTWDKSDAETRGDAPEEPEVSDVILQASKLARGRAVGSGRKPGRPSGATQSTSGATYSGPRRDVKKHIASAFAEVPVGTALKVADIVRHNSDEYGDDHPSSGAVNAALGSPKFDLAGIEPCMVDGVKGAQKVA